MQKFNQKRPVFEAVEMIPRNADELKSLMGYKVAFNDTACHYRLYSELGVTAIGSWLVKTPNGSWEIYPAGMFRENFEMIISEDGR